MCQRKKHPVVRMQGMEPNALQSLTVSLPANPYLEAVVNQVYESVKPVYKSF
jgi:hypothetical protein